MQEVGGEDFAMLARGQDMHGNFTHVTPPKGYFLPEDLARHQEIRLKQAQIMMKDAKGATKMYS